MATKVYYINPNAPGAANGNDGLAPDFQGGTRGPLKDWNTIFDGASGGAARTAVKNDFTAGNDVIVVPIGELKPANQTAAPLINTTGGFAPPKDHPLRIKGTNDPHGALPAPNDWSQSAARATFNGAGTWNKCLYDGGAMPNNVLIENIEFSSAGGSQGWGVHIATTDVLGVKFAQCMWYKNQRWGIVDQSGAGVEVLRSLFVENNLDDESSSPFGGGMYGTHATQCVYALNKGRQLQLIGRNAAVAAIDCDVYGGNGNLGAGILVETTASLFYDAQIVGCTIDGNVVGILFADTANDSTVVGTLNATVLRNLITNNSDAGLEAPYQAVIAAALDNHFFNNASGDKDYSNLSALINMGATFGDPLYRDAGNGDFTLGAGSAAVRAGSRVPGNWPAILASGFSGIVTG